MKWNNRAHLLFLLPTLIGLLVITTSIGLVAPTLEPDDVRYLSQYREFISSSIKNWRLAFVITNSWEDNWWIEPGYVKYFRPLPILTYFLNFYLFGESARALLIVNIACYLALCLSVTGLLYTLTKNQSARTLAGIFFATLPVHSEGVAYIAGRTDVLAWTFGALFLRAHLLQKTTFIKVLFFFGALACKEYSLLLPLFAYFYTYKEIALNGRGRRERWLGYCGLGAVYLLFRHLLLGGSSLHGTPLPLYFPVGTVTGALYHLGLQTLSFVSLSILGLSAPMYSTLITNELITAALISLPIFTGIIFSAHRNACFFPTILLLLFTLVTTAPLYVSLRYYIGPSIAFACCIAFAIERFRTKRVIITFIALPVLILHTQNFSFDMQLQFDNKTRGVVSSMEVISAIGNVKDTIKSCGVVFVLNAPRGQVFHMFLSDFFKAAGDNQAIETVILSVESSKERGIGNAVSYHYSGRDTLLVSSDNLLVSLYNADISLPLERQSIERDIGEDVKIFAESDWKSLRVVFNPDSRDRLCLAEFKYVPGLEVEVRPIQQ